MTIAITLAGKTLIMGDDKYPHQISSIVTLENPFTPTSNDSSFAQIIKGKYGSAAIADLIGLLRDYIYYENPSEDILSTRRTEIYRLFLENQLVNAPHLILTGNDHTNIQAFLNLFTHHIQIQNYIYESIIMKLLNSPRASSNPDNANEEPLSRYLLNQNNTKTTRSLLNFMFKHVEDVFRRAHRNPSVNDFEAIIKLLMSQNNISDDNTFLQILNNLRNFIETTKPAQNNFFINIFRRTLDPFSVFICILLNLINITRNETKKSLTKQLLIFLTQFKDQKYKHIETIIPVELIIFIIEKLLPDILIKENDETFIEDVLSILSYWANLPGVKDKITASLRILLSDKVIEKITKISNLEVKKTFLTLCIKISESDPLPTVPIDPLLIAVFGQDPNRSDENYIDSIVINNDDFSTSIDFMDLFGKWENKSSSPSEQSEKRRKFFDAIIFPKASEPSGLDQLKKAKFFEKIKRTEFAVSISNRKKVSYNELLNIKENFVKQLLTDIQERVKEGEVELAPIISAIKTVYTYLEPRNYNAFLDFIINMIENSHEYIKDIIIKEFLDLLFERKPEILSIILKYLQHDSSMSPREKIVFLLTKIIYRSSEDLIYGRTMSVLNLLRTEGLAHYMVRYSVDMPLFIGLLTTVLHNGTTLREKQHLADETYALLRSWQVNGKTVEDIILEETKNDGNKHAILGDLNHLLKTIAEINSLTKSAEEAPKPVEIVLATSPNTTSNETAVRSTEYTLQGVPKKSISSALDIGLLGMFNLMGFTVKALPAPNLHTNDDPESANMGFPSKPVNSSHSTPE